MMRRLPSFLMSVFFLISTPVFADTDGVLTFQKNFGHVSVRTVVSGDARQHASVEIRSHNELVRVVMLTPTMPMFGGHSYQVGAQTIRIEHLQLSVPSSEMPGQVTIDCNFTDKHGQNIREYSGSVARWRAP